MENVSAKVSVILPTFNESKSGMLPKILAELKKVSDIEVLVIDGGSTDDTVKVVQNFGFEAVKTEHNRRAQRLNVGIQKASGEMLLLHHPRSFLRAAGIENLKTLSSSVEWGAFTHKFDHDHALLRFTSWYSNRVRGDIFGIYYLDHCLYVRKNLFATDQEPFPNIDIFEDTVFCKKLKRSSKPVRLSSVSETSSIRFLIRGIWKQALLNQLLKLAYYFGAPATLMNRIYEGKLFLNSKY